MENGRVEQVGNVGCAWLFSEFVDKRYLYYVWYSENGYSDVYMSNFRSARSVVPVF